MTCRPVLPLPAAHDSLVTGNTLLEIAQFTRNAQWPLLISVNLACHSSAASAHIDTRFPDHDLLRCYSLPITNSCHLLMRWKPFVPHSPHPGAVCPSPHLGVGLPNRAAAELRVLTLQVDPCAAQQVTRVGRGAGTQQDQQNTHHTWRQTTVN